MQKLNDLNPLGEDRSYEPVNRLGFGPGADGFISPTAKSPSRAQAPPAKKRGMHPTEAFLHLLVFIAGAASIVTPVMAIVMYPTGVVMEPITLVKKIYCIFFGFVIILTEATTVGNFTWLTGFEGYVKQYCSLLTRVTGKGLFVIFLGCSLWDCFSSSLDLFTQFILIVTGLYDTGVGLVMVFFGLKMAWNLRKLRNNLLAHKYNGVLIMPNRSYDAMETGLLEKLTEQEALYPYLNTFAKTYPGQAMTRVEFQELVQFQTGSMLGTWELNATCDALNTEAEVLQESVDKSKGMRSDASDTLTFQAIWEWLQPGPAPLL